MRIKQFLFKVEQHPWVADQMTVDLRVVSDDLECKHYGVQRIIDRIHLSDDQSILDALLDDCRIQLKHVIKAESGNGLMDCARETGRY